MENDNKRVSEGKLLYDPLFAKKPDLKIKDDPTKGFFGKAIVRKTGFVIVLLIFVGLSLFFSFNSISKDLFAFEEKEDGSYMLDEYHGGNRAFLSVDYVRGEDNVPDTSKPVTEVRRFAVCCDEFVNFIFIGKDVDVIDSKGFYTCKNLYAVIVDAENDNYVSIDGVLYSVTDGVPTELVLYPIDNGEYRTALSMGIEAPQTEDGVAAFNEAVKALTEAEKTQADADGNLTRTAFDVRFDEIGAKYAIAETVTKIGELSFANCERLTAVTIPDGVREIGNLAFIECKNLQAADLPDGLVAIGSDAFSLCDGLTDIYLPATVETIGHHAFYECSGIQNIRMECSEEEMDAMEIGEGWIKRVVNERMVNINILYNETREVQ